MDPNVARLNMPKPPVGERLERWWALEQVSWFAALRLKKQSQAALQRALDRWPHDPDLLQRLAFNDAQEGQIDRAISVLQECLRLHPDLWMARYNLGYLLQQAEQHQAALDAFQAVVDQKPSHDLALYGGALSLIALDRKPEAIAVLKQVIKLQPMSPFAYYQLGRIYHEQGKREKVERLIAQLRGFEPKIADQLQRETRN